MPFYHDGKTGRTEAMTIKANPDLLGPKIKEFRKAFTKYSFPPSLKKSLWKLLPPNYPSIPQYINPFEGGDSDDYNKMLYSEKEISVPVIYLLEHSISLSTQDLADIWQGVLPDIGTTMTVDMTSIDHYMPGEDAGPSKKTIFPEILQKELELGLPSNGHPRVDLLDTTVLKDMNSFNPTIKWLIFKVKQQGIPSYSEFIFSEINGGVDSRAYNKIFGAISKNLPDDERRRLEAQRSLYTKNLYFTEEFGKGFNTFNWPYDYCSLIESSKLTTTVGFRPDLDKEVQNSQEGETLTFESGLPTPFKPPKITPATLSGIRPALALQTLPTLPAAPLIQPRVQVSPNLQPTMNVSQPIAPAMTPATPIIPRQAVAPVVAAAAAAPMTATPAVAAPTPSPPRANPVRNISAVVRAPRLNVSAISRFGSNNRGGGGNFGGGGGNFGGGY